MSNGSEHTPERGEHAVDGPDWAGLRELNNAEVDYKALVKQARGFVPIMESGNLILALADAVEAWLAIEQRLTDHIVQLAAERDALQAENAQLQVYLSENRRALDDAINVANGNKSARDALQARLDALAKRHASALGAISRVRSSVMSTDGDYLDGGDFEGLAGEVQAALGPWTVVAEGDAHGDTVTIAVPAEHNNVIITAGDLA